MSTEDLLYPVPTGVNQVWYDGRCEEGVVWGVMASQAPMNVGDTITLRVDDQYYSDYYSEFTGGLADGTEVWVQVDAVNIDTDYGGVLESHEASDGAYNNIDHVVVGSSASSSADETSKVVTGAEGGLTTDSDLPPRPAMR